MSMDIEADRRQQAPAAAPALHWLCRPFAGLGVDMLYALLRLRQQVFNGEQNTSYVDADGVDPRCWHLIGHAGELREARALACLRIVPPGLKYPEPSIGRVATHVDVRGSGLGMALLAKGVARSLQLYPGQGLRISAQAYLRDFYGRFGFAAVGEEYLEDGIPHIEMLRGGERPVRSADWPHST